MKRISLFIPVIFMAVYVGIFLLQEKLVVTDKDQLSTIPPQRLIKASFGYVKQLVAESIYVKTSVYLGSNHPQRTLLRNEESIADHFIAITNLHPKFKDTYFLCEGFLPAIGKQSAKRANEVLDMGRRVYPDFMIFDIFSAFNCFYYLDEPVQAAGILKDIEKKHSDAPPWIGKLASILLAQGGELYTGLSWLKLMHKGEKDEKARERYEKDIRVFENAISVQQATIRYKNKYGVAPEKLDMIVPEFIRGIPDPGKEFVYAWAPPTLKLMRPKIVGNN